MRETMKLRNTLPFAVGLLAVTSVAFGADKFGAWTGKPAPAFKMTDTSGKVWTNSSLKGKVVILDFWASWCAPCKAASPIMQKLSKTYGAQGLVVIGAEAEGGPKSIAPAYAKEHGYSYKFTTNNDALLATFGPEGIPAFVIIGKDGKVARTFEGVPRKIDELFGIMSKTIKPLL
jgi:thiol-disulfide isomerase/thioredoxin